MTNKYHNKKAKSQDGNVFSSKLERNRYEELRLLEMAGEIKDLVLQPEYVLLHGFRDRHGKYHRPIKYRADFGYHEGVLPVIEESKGYDTAVWKIKQKLFLSKYPEIELRVIR
jgi:hypothetical protein